MSQTFDDGAPAQGNDWDDDLPAIKNNFAALKSGFSGSAAPSNAVGGMPWQHNTAAKGRRIRNIGNTAWLASLLGDAGQKMYVYRNDTCDGWLIDTTLGDRVLAIKDQAAGGGAFDVSGGIAAGTWTQPDHVLTADELPAHDHGAAGSHLHQGLQAYRAAGGGAALHAATAFGTVSASGATTKSWSGNASYYRTASGGTHTHTSVGAGDAHNHGNAWRPAAAVGTLQYPDLT